jgi:hypothetical protein
MAKQQVVVAKDSTGQLHKDKNAVPCVRRLLAKLQMDFLGTINFVVEKVNYIHMITLWYLQLEL